MNKKETIASIIRNNWEDSKIISVWNRRCEECGYSGDKIFVNDEDNINKALEGRDAHCVLGMAFFGKYNYFDNYFRFNAYGNLVSFNKPLLGCGHYDIEDIVDYLIENGDTECEIDTDILMQNFLYEYFEKEHWDEMEGWIEKITEEETFDLLTEDWDDLYISLKNFSGCEY